MASAICTGASMMCSFGVAPSSLIALPGTVLTNAPPSANTTTNAPIANVAPFGACTSLSNPTVAAATSAALGVLTPMPCIPATAAPWSPGAAKTMNGGMPAVDQSCTLNCSYGGVITVVSPGQVKLSVS